MSEVKVSDAIDSVGTTISKDISGALSTISNAFGQIGQDIVSGVGALGSILIYVVVGAGIIVVVLLVMFFAGHGQKPAQATQGTDKPVSPEGGRKSEVLRLLKEFPQNLERKSQSKIKIIKEIPRSEWNRVKEGFEKEGWKYDWEEKAFLISEEGKV
jgi:hypothetical protein